MSPGLGMLIQPASKRAKVISTKRWKCNAALQDGGQALRTGEEVAREGGFLPVKAAVGRGADAPFRAHKAAFTMQILFIQTSPDCWV